MRISVLTRVFFNKRKKIRNIRFKKKTRNQTTRRIQIKPKTKIRRIWKRMGKKKKKYFETFILFFSNILYY